MGVTAVDKGVDKGSVTATRVSVGTGVGVTVAVDVGVAGRGVGEMVVLAVPPWASPQAAANPTNNKNVNAMASIFLKCKHLLSRKAV